MRMQQVRWFMAVFTMLVAFPVSTLRAAYIETFSNPPNTEGWIAQAGSQSNPGGYLQSTNAIAAFPWIAPAAGASGGNFEGDIWTKHGSSPTFSFDVAVLSEATQASSMRLFFYKVGQYPNYWQYNWAGTDLEQSDGWVHLSVPLNQAWDDATYLANGWTKNGSPSSFVDVLSNLGPEYDIQATPGSFTTGSTNVVGWDNIGWSTVPEPASATLLIFGLVSIGSQATRRRSR